MIRLQIKQSWKVEALAMKLDKAVSFGVDGAAEVFTQRVRSSLSRTTLGTPSPVGSPPSRQTGQLYAGITWHRDGKGARVGVLKSIPYAAIQEFGGTIQSRSGGFLPIPIHPLAKARARMRRGPRSFPFLHLIRTKSGKLLLVRKVGGRNARFEIYYVLKKRVVIPARPYFYPQARNQQTLTAMNDAFVANAQKVLGVA